ncbi:MAG TPA: zf-HC2 domain-containing protein [Croceibacterium sp.]|nr:zf-HC2 domain-containing protein [Croceibacterium sp.]
MGDLLHLHNEHDKARMLLPWFVNGTLEADEAALVEAHLDACDECRADLAANRALREVYAASSAGAKPEQPAQAMSVRGSRGLDQPPARRWRKLAQFALPAAAAVALIVAIAPSPDESGYRLLGSDAPAQAGNAIVLFAPETTERDLRAALEQAGARLVDGPTASGAYVVQVPARRRDDALAGLRAMPQVVLAEPVDAAGGP